MLLLKLFRPKNIPLRRDEWGRWIRFYVFILKRLIPLYRRCAKSDIINVGGTQVIHNVRDYWYEQELQRFHLATDGQMKKQSLPYSVKRRFRNCALFDWTESVLVFHNGESYNITRGKSLLIESEINGKFSVSTEEDIVVRSEFVSAGNENEHHSATSESSTRPKSDGENDSHTETTSTSETKTQRVRHQGFVENEIF